MGPVARLAAARVTIFIVVATGVTMLPLSLDPVLGLVIAFVLSMLVSASLLRRTRNEVSEGPIRAVERRAPNGPFPRRRRVPPTATVTIRAGSDLIRCPIPPGPDGHAGTGVSTDHLAPRCRATSTL